MPAHRLQSNTTKARSRWDILSRRRQVSLLFEAGLSQQEIAAQLGVSEATISGDTTAIKAALARSSEEHMGARRDREVAALDADEATLRAQVADWDRENGIKALVELYKAIGAIQDRRAAWLGFAQPAKAPSSTAALDALLAALDGEGAA